MTESPAVDVAGLAGRRWTFGPAVLDERSLELEIAGEQVALERKPLEVLLYLLHHAGEVVTKDDLAESLWPGRILTETVLTRCISVLRQALRDDDKTLVRTVHGYGYRLVADVRVEASTAGAPPAFDFKPGDHPPLRPQWKLVERLGTGGHGEAWLARHEKTGDARVFKFALDAGALTSLKREITLYRLLHDSLGARAAIARIFEWNLAEPPYFIEMEHISGGNLQVWGEAQGGLSGIPPPLRLELAAQIAEALAAAHSVGALHKDLKPANVLVDMGSGKPTVRLCDFGSGGVLDPQRLEALGITRLGFTKTLADGAGAGTPLYLAPEVVAGQPFTVQADVYALGVLLYQLVTGDLRKALAPGWEADVVDELLREDIAAAAAGNPVRRLTDAAQLVERLRTLDARRQARAAEVAARQRAELVRRTIAELRRTRAYAMLLLTLTAVAIVGGVMAHRARNEAVAATATAKAIGDFLMEDVLSIDPLIERPKDASYQSLLTRASKRVESRFEGQDEAAASVHWLLGRRYQEVGLYDDALREYQRAAELYERMYGRGAEATLVALERLATIYVDRGRVPEALQLAEEIRGRWLTLYGATNLSTLMVRARLARAIAFAGGFAEAEQEYRSILREIPLAAPATPKSRALFKQWFGATPPLDSQIPAVLTAYVNATFGTNVLAEFGDQYTEAESRVRSALDIFRSILGEETEVTTMSKIGVAYVLMLRGGYEESERLLIEVRDFFDGWMPSGHHLRGLPRVAMARLRLEQKRPKEAASLTQQALESCQGCTPRVEAELLWDLGRAQTEMSQWQKAIDTLNLAAATYEKSRGPTHVGVIRIQIDLADAFRGAGRWAEARAKLEQIDKQALFSLPRHPVTAAYRRIEGSLLLNEGRAADARGALEESLRIFDALLGPKHWRTERARAELALAAGIAPQKD